MYGTGATLRRMWISNFNILNHSNLHWSPVHSSAVKADRRSSITRLQWAACIRSTRPIEANRWGIGFDPCLVSLSPHPHLLCMAGAALQHHSLLLLGAARVEKCDHTSDPESDATGICCRFSPYFCDAHTFSGLGKICGQRIYLPSLLHFFGGWDAPGSICVPSNWFDDSRPHGPIAENY